jgi:hypothetical protein
MEAGSGLTPGPASADPTPLPEGEGWLEPSGLCRGEAPRQHPAWA